MVETLTHYLGGKWQAGRGAVSALVNPSTEETLAEVAGDGIDLAKALGFARGTGRPALQELSFGQRGELLRRMAQGIADIRDSLIAAAVINGGATRSDAAFDIDGATATLNYYAKLAENLRGETRLDGEPLPLGRSGRLLGHHRWITRGGVAVQLNPYSAPAWALAAKCAPALLSGTPVIAKPATATALVPYRIVRRWAEARAFPPGAFSLYLGRGEQLRAALPLLGPADVVAFTGRAETAERLRQHNDLHERGVRLDLQLGGANLAVLGTDVSRNSALFERFLTDVFRETTQKAGQKATSLRRLFVPRALRDAVREHLVEKFRGVRLGNPSDGATHMGPLATGEALSRARTILEGSVERGEVVVGGPEPRSAHAAPAGRGFFIAPTLLMPRRIDSPFPFGPVVSLHPYERFSELVPLVARSGAALMLAVYAEGLELRRALALTLSAHYGRVVVIGPKDVEHAARPGIVLPQLTLGGPGCVGDGEALGGLRALGLYQRRVAFQAGADFYPP